ncbi:MAG TPA: PucR family transcriptional regulator, partial [Thermomonospora sp.]|nr:PucR family transcriptional regulator [Thermomonospora sp.]
MDAEETAGFLALLRERARDPRLLEGTIRAARGRSPLVAALPEEETRRHTRALLAGAVDALAGDGEPGAEALAAAERLGSDRARQGVPVAALLDGFQAGRSHLVRALIDDGLARGVPAEVLLESVTRIDAITTALVHRMVHAHRVTELDMARTAREGRVQTLRQLLHGEPVPVPAPLDASAAYHCVVSDISDPALAQRLEPVLCGAGGGLAGLAGLVDGRLAVLTPRLPGPGDLPAGTP